MSNLVRKTGVPALASSLFDHASCPGTLMILVNEQAQRATIELQVEVSIQGFEAVQQITLIYDADNFEPGTTTVRDVPPSPGLLAQVARPRGGMLKSLSLVLHQPCIVLSSAPGSLCAKEPGDVRFEQLAALARATRVDIVFDAFWLHPDKRAQFGRLVGSSGLTGFPRRKGTRDEADWTIFCPSQVGLPEDEAAPPEYDESLKRPRQPSPASPRTPPKKRLLLDIDLGSPTEKATTATPSAPSSSPVQSAPPLDPLEAAEAAMAKLLPSAVRDVLPQALVEVLPGILTHMFAAPTPISTPSGSTHTNPPTTPPPPNPLSPLHRVIRARLHATAEHVADQIATDNFAHAQEARDAADVALEECLEEHRLELVALKEDGLLEMHRLHDARLDQLEEHTREIVETVEADAAEAYTSVREKIDEMVCQQRAALVRERLDVAVGCRCGIDKREDRQRASSVPLDVAW